jgi:enoyl-CoA hydratase/carnithine racemase
MGIEVSQSGHQLRIHIRRPEKMNALSRSMFHQLAGALHTLSKDPELRVGVIFAEGPHFTSGVDLLDWKEAFAAGTPFPIAEHELDPFGISGPRLQKPLVIAMQGRCYTWGWELMLNCDIRIAAGDTRFAMLEVKRGFYACGGATLRLPQEIGWARAQRYLLTGDEMSAEQALEFGMINELCEPGEQLARAIEIAERIAAAAPLGVQGSLASARQAWLHGELSEISRMFPRLATIMQSEDVQEGVRSFIERRPAVFRGH